MYASRPGPPRCPVGGAPARAPPPSRGPESKRLEGGKHGHTSLVYTPVLKATKKKKYSPSGYTSSRRLRTRSAVCIHRLAEKVAHAVHRKRRTSEAALVEPTTSRNTREITNGSTAGERGGRAAERPRARRRERVRESGRTVVAQAAERVRQRHVGSQHPRQEEDDARAEDPQAQDPRECRQLAPHEQTGIQHDDGERPPEVLRLA